MVSVMDNTEKNEALLCFTWSALVAIKIAEQDDKISSPFTEHMFIMNWLSEAQKKKLFSKEVAADIDWLISEGRNKGVNARLKFKIECLRTACGKDNKPKSALLRFASIFELLDVNGWECYLATAPEWKKISKSEIKTHGNFIYVQERKIRESFGKDGGLLCQLKLRVSGDVETAENIFRDNALNVEIQHIEDLNQFYFILSPDKK